MRNIALGGDFSAEFNAVQQEVGPDDQLVTGDSRLQFHYGDQVDLQAPENCAQLRSEKRVVFVLLESDEIRSIYGDKATADFWSSCTSPSLTKVTERPGAFALFVTGAPRGRCDTAAPDSRPAVEFGRFKAQAAANGLYQRIQGAGFVEAKLEQVSCDELRIVEYVPDDATGSSVIAEAKRAGFTPRLVEP
jgi:hypothetical protein